MSEEVLKEKVLLTFVNLKDCFKFLGDNVESSSLWEFYPMPQFTEGRGEEGENCEIIYINRISEYSFIKRDDTGILVRLDAEANLGDKLRIRFIRDSQEENILFQYNKVEDCYDASIPGGTLLETKFEIVEVLDEN